MEHPGLGTQWDTYTSGRLTGLFAWAYLGGFVFMWIFLNDWLAWERRMIGRLFTGSLPTSSQQLSWTWPSTAGCQATQSRASSRAAGAQLREPSPLHPGGPVSRCSTQKLHYGTTSTLPPFLTVGTSYRTRKVCKKLVCVISSAIIWKNWKNNVVTVFRAVGRQTLVNRWIRVSWADSSPVCLHLSCWYIAKYIAFYPSDAPVQLTVNPIEG